MTDLGASLFGPVPADHLGRVTQALEANNIARAVTLADAALVA
jgi:hypothetical protein